MGESRVVRPETWKLSLSGGDWIVVRKRLTAGENKRMVRRSSVQGADGLRYDSIEAGTARILAYLLDWSLPGPDGTTIPIRGESSDVVEAAIDSLDPTSYGEILRAIEAHAAAMEAERVAEKNGQGDGTGAAVISPLPSAVAGASTGSAS